MATIENTLEPPTQKPAGFLLRSHRPGDIGWVVSRHGALYAREYGWDIHFEALVAEIAAQFIRSYDPSREHCWIAEIGGEPVGSVFLVKASDEVAKLRLLLVDKKARGLGVGRALTEQCIRFARDAGYTLDHAVDPEHPGRRARNLSARRISRVGEEKHHSFGVDLVGETWELKLCIHSGAMRSRTRISPRNLRIDARRSLGLGRRRCSSSRGMISTKLHGRVR